jgi:hypothetical protein
MANWKVVRAALPAVIQNGLNGVVAQKIKLTLEQVRKARGGVEVQISSFFNLSTLWEWVVNATPQPLHAWERDPVPILQEAGWAPGPVWMVAEIHAPTRIPSPDRPAHRESLYRLHYPGKWRKLSDKIMSMYFL